MWCASAKLFKRILIDMQTHYTNSLMKSICIIYATHCSKVRAHNTNIGFNDIFKKVYCAFVLVRMSLLSWLLRIESQTSAAREKIQIGLSSHCSICPHSYCIVTYRLGSTRDKDIEIYQDSVNSNSFML